MNKVRVTARNNVSSILHVYISVMLDMALLYRHIVDNNSAVWNLNFACTQEKHAAKLVLVSH